MNLRTFGQLKGEIARVCGVSGMAVTDPRVMSMTNLAVEELVNEGDFPWTVERFHLRVFCGRIVLPTEFDRIYSLRVDGVPQQINSPWYQLVYGTSAYDYGSRIPPGYNNWDGDWLENLGLTMDRDQVFQFRDIPCDQWYFLKITTQFDEAVDSVYPKITFNGWDANKSPVTTEFDGQWIEGEKISLQTGAKSTSTFGEISGIIKPVTKGEVYVYAVNSDESVKVHVGTYAPGDTAPFYRSYKVAGSGGECPSCVEIRARRRYQPIRGDDDFVMLGNIPALKKMVQAVWFSDAGDPDKYVFYKNASVDLLKKEAKSFRGKVRTPFISMARGYPLGAFPFIR